MRAVDIILSKRDGGNLSRDVATFFRVLQRHYLPFVEMLRWKITMRSEFERLCRMDPDTLTDLERSARFYYLQRTAFGGKVDGRTFGASATPAAAEAPKTPAASAPAPDPG